MSSAPPDGTHGPADGLDAASEIGTRMSAFWADAVACLVAVARGQPERAHGHLDHASRTGSAAVLGGEWLMYASALTAEADGDLGGAARAAEGVGRAIVGSDGLALLLNGGPELVRICQAAGRTSSAQAIADGLRSVTARTGSPIAGALSAWANGLVDGDGEAIAGAAEALAACGRVPQAARARHVAAVMAARRGDIADARHVAKQAFAGYDALAADAWHRQLRADLQAAGLPMRPRRGAERAESGWPSLTASEQTIVELVGSGLTNTEIAGRLFVSRRTVESHLGRVYSKLDLTTRSQLVAAVARRIGAV